MPALRFGPVAGNLLNIAHVTWGWFQGGFAPTGKTSSGLPICGASHENIGGNAAADYSPHHNPFEYYKSTSNPQHLAPTAAIGRTDRANHNYDLSLFFKTLKAGNMPSVSFLKAAEYQDGHAGYSDPLDEQHFLVNTINKIEESRFWKSTAIVITYDDSDGWYDHQASKIVNGSHNGTLDTPMCKNAKIQLGTRGARCGYGPRLPWRGLPRQGSGISWAAGVSVSAGLGSRRTWRPRRVRSRGLPRQPFRVPRPPGVAAALAAWRASRRSSAAAPSPG